MPLSEFHPLTQTWFDQRFSAPTEPQRLGWPVIAAGRDVLIAAPTGSGKTLAAFLASLDRLLRLSLDGRLEDRTYVAYVSPLRALSNDIQRNLRQPLAELLALAREQYPLCAEIRALVRTGDTSPQERQQMLRKPPHILVTTPESLYLLLTARRSREMLRSVETVIVDEIHALARDKRGAHLSLSLERLDALCQARERSSEPLFPSGNGRLTDQKRPVRIGLSATQKPLDDIARFLVGTDSRSGSRLTSDGCPGRREPALQLPVVVDTGHMRELDLAVEVPQRELEAVCMHEHWAEIYDRLVSLIRNHRSTLIFVNTRRLAERVAHQLTERLGEEAISSHHGSLAHKMRHRTEQRLKEGSLKAVIATASLELGIDIGHIDLVCQLGSPRSIATFLQRVGRAGHWLGVVPKGRLFALTRDELIECLALVRAVYAGRLDRIEIPDAPLDILAQQMVAAVACDEWDEDELFALCRRAYPYRDLSRDDYDTILELVSEGIVPGRNRRGAYLHRDRVNRRLRARRGARMTAITCGGAIPEVADYRVVTDDENHTYVGTVDEDFAVESLAGDIFLLGNTSWQVRHVRGGEVVVRDAHGAPPNIPFWRGEAPGRTFELSAEVAALREELDDREQAPAMDWLIDECHVSRQGAEQAAHYVAAQKAAVGMLPTQRRILFERFFDESGGMQLVVHAPFGTRINRAWGLALRKRFCRTFDFELQASADDNGIVLSLGAQHSFPLEQMFRLVPSQLARDVLIQAFLAVPFFNTRWRWNATRALVLQRWQGGRRVPPYLQRMRSDDLLSAVFPQQTACQENVTGDIEVPDHPLVNQTVHDCLHEATDIDGFLRVLRDIENGTIEVVGLDTREPSPFSHQLLNANPYAFLDDAPLEERRARAVTLRRTLPIESLRDLGRLDPDAIAQVRREAWPLVRDADELHEALLSMGGMPASEGNEWRTYFDELTAAGRATVVVRPGGPPLWATTERWPLVRAIWPEATPRPEVTVPDGIRRDWSREEACAAIVRGRLECIGPTAAGALASSLAIPFADVQRALMALENDGTVLRGRFTGESELLSSVNGTQENGEESLEWCERRLLARIHRLTLEGLRRQIEPVSPERFVQFLIRHQHLDPLSRLRSQAGVLELVEQFQGFEAPAVDWERFLFPSRMESYDPTWLDSLTLSGEVMWGRLRPVRWSEERSRPMKALTRNIPLTLMKRKDLSWLLPAADGQTVSAAPLGGAAQTIYDILSRHGALFVGQIAALAALTMSQVENALGELAAAGLVTSDGFAALRSIARINPLATRRGSHRAHRHARQARREVFQGGRWSLLRIAGLPETAAEGRVESWCRLLLRRYGLMFRDLLARESAAPAWRDLVAVYRRLEARGEVRGGRFVAGVAGEQYALPEAVSRIRRTDDDARRDGKPFTLSATDPLNLSGRVAPGPKIPAVPRNRIVLQNGALLAYRMGKEVQLVEAAELLVK